VSNFTGLGSDTILATGRHSLTVANRERTFSSFTVPLEHEAFRHDSVDLRQLVKQLEAVKSLRLRIQSLTTDCLVIRFVFSTIELRIHFGSVNKPLNQSSTGEFPMPTTREIIKLDLVSLL